MPLDPTKPLAEDVLKSLSLGLDFDNGLIELCANAASSSIVEGNLVGLVHINPANVDGEALKCSKETATVGFLLAQSLICEGEVGPTAAEERDTSPILLPTDELRSTGIIETLDSKVIHHIFFV